MKRDIRQEPPQYRLDLYDDRYDKDDILLKETLGQHGDHALATLVPAGQEVRLGEDRMRVTFHFPQNLLRRELVELFRWIGSLADFEANRIFDQWEIGRLHRAGVRLERLPGTSHAYPLDSLALVGPLPKKSDATVPPAISPEPEAMSSEDVGTSPDADPSATDVPIREPGVDADSALSAESHVPVLKRPRRRTAAGRRPRYSIVRKKHHAQLVVRGGHGKGEVRAVAKIDLADVERVLKHSWHLHGSGDRLEIETDSKANDGLRLRIGLHRFVSDAGPGETVTFLNDDRFDFRRENLSVGPGARRTYKNNSTGFRNVSLNKKTGKYEAEVGKTRLGSYATPEEAFAVAQAERERRGWQTGEAAR